MLLFSALNSSLKYQEALYIQNAEEGIFYKLKQSSWKEIVVIVGNANNRFSFYITAAQANIGLGMALTNGYSFGNKDSYCIFDIKNDSVRLYSFISSGEKVTADISAYIR